MKIIRDGKEFELTREEMRKAFYEQELEFYAEDIRSRYEVSDEELGTAVNMFYDWLEHSDPYFDVYWDTMACVCHELGIKEREEY